MSHSDSAQSLFRPEVIKSRASDTTGSRLRAHSPLGRFTLLVALLPALGLAALLVFGESTRKARVTGQLVPSSGITLLRAPVAGTVISAQVAEGSRVRRGDALMLIEDERSTLHAPILQQQQSNIARRVDAELAVLNATGQRDEARREGLTAQRADLDREIAALSAELPLAREQAVLVEDGLTRLRNLSERGHVAGLQVNQQEIELLARLAAARQLERQLASLSRARNALSQQLDELAASQSIERAQGALALETLERERMDSVARGKQVVRAPIDGLVAAQSVFPGQTVEAGKLLMSLLPDGGSLEAHLVVPSRAIGFVTPGSTVMIRYAAYPYQKYGHHAGRVVRVTHSPLDAAELAQAGIAGAGDEPHYRVIVRLDQDSILLGDRVEPLRVGLSLEADVMIERRRLIDWVLAPAKSLGARIANGAGNAH